MDFTLRNIGILVSLLLVVSWYIEKAIRVARFKKQHECQPIYNRLPQLERVVGVDLYRTQISASKDGRILELAQGRYDTYGMTWSARMMGQTYVNTIDIENIKTILASNFKDFGLGQRQEAFGAMLGQGIFTTGGNIQEQVVGSFLFWSPPNFKQALVRPNFTRAQVADLDSFEAHIQQFISKIPRDGTTVDLQPLFFRLTLDTATEFLFGESVKSLNSTEGSEEDSFQQAYDLAQSRLANRGRLGKLVHLCSDREFDAACKTVHRFVDKIIFKSLEKLHPRDAEKSIDGNGQPERYVFLKEMLKSTRDPKQLRDELLNILLAGRDTTASLLSNTFHVLARRPDIWKKLKAEVDGLQGLKPNYETLRNMKYLKYLLNESLRLYPVVPNNARFANKDTVLPRGGGPNGDSPIFIPKGGIVAYHVYAMHRRKDIYGPDALEFRPERWGSDLRPSWGYLPFNGGPRICVGQQFALTEASYTIVRLLQAFGGIEDRDGSAWTEQLSLTCCSANGVKVAMTLR